MFCGIIVPDGVFRYFASAVDVQDIIRLNLIAGLRIENSHSKIRLGKFFFVPHCKGKLAVTAHISKGGIFAEFQVTVCKPEINPVN